MKRRAVPVLAGVGVVFLTFVVTPHVLRRLAFFEVRQVELVGVRYLSPHALVRALELRSDQNVFDDRNVLVERALGVRGIIGARIERRLPGTLRVIVTEQVAMAMAPGPQGFVALDARGQPLPYDPAVTGLDLPIVARPDTLLVEVLGVIRIANLDLFHEVDWVDFTGAGDIGVYIGERRWLFAPAPSVRDIDAVLAVRQELERSGAAYDELDARYRGWIVARRGGP
ncbi:MAG: FtsQ-type POTRA domain-containing protein [Gemmatimonadetes bacterium]|nr:FtsQ-type POTRA domain-containing protein [Gemmatimonadota bacterium]